MRRETGYPRVFKWQLILTTLLFVFFSAEISYSAEIDNVKAAIKANGARWTAREKPVDKPRGLGLLIPPLTEKQVSLSSPPAYKALASLPSGLDWRNNGGNFVTPVRDQGSCGSCWAFATTAALESYTLISSGTPGVDLDLSEQVVTSCTGQIYNNCDGGYIDDASNFIRDTGVPLESCYPYISGDDGLDKPCSGACLNWRTATYNIPDWSYVANGFATASALKNGLYAYGPLVVTMYVYNDFYQFYHSGVYSYTSGIYKGGHAVLLVGYDDTGQYFIVKNSWGDEWGESGYFRIAYSEVESLVGFGTWTLNYGYPRPDTEIVSVPLYFSGPASGTANTSYTYTVGGSSSNLGHSVQYVIDWGDLSEPELLPEGTTRATKSWSIANTYSVRMKARCVDDTDIESDWSEPRSVVISEAPYSAVTLLAPGPAHVIPSGSSYRIQWDAPPRATTFKVLYSPDNGVSWKTLTSGGNIAEKYYDWTVPTPLNSLKKCLIKVVGFNGKVRVGNNIPSPFAIEVVRLTSPNGGIGQSLTPGGTETISWITNATKNTVARVTLYYSIDNGATWKLIRTFRSNAGNYDWQVPSVPAVKSKCKMKVVLRDASGNVVGSDLSDNVFTINLF